MPQFPTEGSSLQHRSCHSMGFRLQRITSPLIDRARSGRATHFLASSKPWLCAYPAGSYASLASVVQIMPLASSRTCGLKTHKTPILYKWKSCCHVVDGSRCRTMRVHSRKPPTRRLCSDEHQLQLPYEATSQANSSTSSIGGLAHLSRMTFQSRDL